jgi:hypothetical protein
MNNHYNFVNDGVRVGGAQEPCVILMGVTLVFCHCDCILARYGKLSTSKGQPDELTAHD